MLSIALAFEAFALARARDFFAFKGILIKSWFLGHLFEAL